VIPLIRVNMRRAVGDWRLLVVATLFPVMFILITGLLTGSAKEPIGLLHPSARLVDLAERSGDVKVRVESTRADLVDDILRGRIVAGVVGLPSSPGTVRADLVTESAQTDAVQARTDMIALLDLIAAEGPRVRLTDTTLDHAHTPAPLSPFAYVAPADLVLFMGITVLLLSSGLVQTRRLGIIRRLAAAPIRRRSIVAAEMAGMLAVAVGQSLGLLLVGRVLFGVHWGDPIAVGLILVLLALSFAGASVVIGVWSRTQEQAIAVAVVVGIAGGMLGGSLYPLDVVGSTVREVGHLTPQAWAMDGFIKLIYHHGGFTSVLPEIGALAVFALLLSALALRLYARTVYSPG
jgi:ABC-2 type transport system permease protein